MRIAVSGAHGTGKSTLIAAFLAQRPDYVYEAEAFETLADEVDLTASEGSDLEGLSRLLEFTLAVLDEARPGTTVVFERSPVDYLAYAMAGRREPPSVRRRFVRAHARRVSRALRHLDLIVLVPVSPHVEARAGESPRLRRRVDETLRRLLIDDELGLFEGQSAPERLELSPEPGKQLTRLLEIAAAPKTKG